MHSENYEKVLRWYKLGAWNVARVRNAVARGWITAEEFFEITGEAYVAT